MRDSTQPGSHLFRPYFLSEVARKFPVLRGHSQYPQSPYDNGKQLVILTNRETQGDENEFLEERCGPERNNEQNQQPRVKGKDANGERSSKGKEE
jgi:hypothetical protein